MQNCSLFRSPRLLSEISQTEVCTSVCHVSNKPTIHRTHQNHSTGVWCLQTGLIQWEYMCHWCCAHRGDSRCAGSLKTALHVLYGWSACGNTWGCSDELWNIQKGKNKVGKSLKHFRSHLEQNPTRDIGTDLQWLYQDEELVLGISHVYIHQEQQIINDNVKIKKMSSLSGPHLWVHAYTSLPTSLAFQHYSLLMAVQVKPSNHLQSSE